MQKLHLFFQLLLLLTLLNYLVYSVSPLEIFGKKTYKRNTSFHVTGKCFSSAVKVLENLEINKKNIVPSPNISSFV